MENEIEETNANPVEEVTPETQPQVEEKETPKTETEQPKEQFTDREKRYYARMKRAEEEAKFAKESLAKTKETLAKAKIPISDIDAILEVQSSTKDLDKNEIAELKLRASALGVSLTEARQDPNYLIWQSAYRVKVEKENAPKPSTIQAEGEKPKTLPEELKSVTEPSILADIRKLKEKEAILEREGLWKSPRKEIREEKFKLSP